MAVKLCSTPWRVQQGEASLQEGSDLTFYSVNTRFFRITAQAPFQRSLNTRGWPCYIYFGLKQAILKMSYLTGDGSQRERQRCWQWCTVSCEDLCYCYPRRKPCSNFFIFHLLLFFEVPFRTHSLVIIKQGGTWEEDMLLEGVDTRVDGPEAKGPSVCL